MNNHFIVVCVKPWKMGILINFVLLIFLVVEGYALTCRSDHNAKKEESRKVLNNCLKQQEGKETENKRQSSKNNNNNWRNRDENQRNQWEKNDRNINRENGERISNSDASNGRDRNREQRINSNGRNDGRQSSMNINSGMDGRYYTNSERDNTMDNRNGIGRGTSRNDGHDTTEHLRGQDEFLESEEYFDRSQHNYYPSVRPPRRYKREKRIEINSGQRSQYNPHSQRSNGNRENNQENDGRNSSDNYSKETDNGCVLHCIMENLHMTGDNGMPDRYLVTHALTKDEKNEDFRDFLQESIEECFQILDNENTEDKCEFSKNLSTCLSEKGRSNCDQWNGNSNFLY